ncbi:MAG: twin-arginine translocation signal domain-containing protein [Bacteroidota bacterium]
MTTTRRTFIKQTAAVAARLSILNSPLQAFASEKISKIRFGFIGVGLRGQSHLEEALNRKDCEVQRRRC